MVLRFCIILLIFASSASAQYVDIIDPSVRYQRIEYFAASDCWSMEQIGKWSPANRSKVADLLFSPIDGIGLSAWRFNLAGGVERTRIRNPWRTADTFETQKGTYDWTRCPGQRLFLAAAKQRGVPTFIAFCNSPPRRLTVNGLTSIDPGAAHLTNNLKPGMEREYGIYLADILQHFRDNPLAAERVDFKWISPINEPQWDWIGGQEGTRASNADIARQYEAIGTALKARQLTTHILGPESGSIPDLFQLDRGVSDKYKSSFGNYVEMLSRDPVMGELLDHEVGYHSYWSDSVNQIITHRQQLRVKLDEHPQWRAAETEYCIMERRRDLSMATALRAMRVLYADLTIVNAVAWSWWTAVSNGDYKDGLIYTDYHQAGDTENIIPSKLLWALGNYARFVRPGMVRIEIKSTGAGHDLDGVMGSAYLNISTGQIVAVYVNSKPDAVTLELRTAGSADFQWTSFITSDKPGDDLRKIPATANPIAIPGRSVVTLVR